MEKKIAIIDSHYLLPAPFIDDISDKADVIQKVFSHVEAFNDLNTLRKWTRTYSMGIGLELEDRRSTPKVARNSFVSGIEILIYDDADDLPRLTKKYDLEKYWRGVMKFFISYADNRQDD